MTIIPPGFAEITMPITHNGLARSAAVVFGLELDGIGPDADQIASAMQGLFVATLGTRIDNSCNIGPARAAVGQDGGLPVLGFASGPVQAGRSLNSVPPALAVLIDKRTGLGGRRGRGRMYLPWALPEGNVNEVGLIDTSEVNLTQAAAVDWLDGFASQLAIPVLLHDEGLSAVPPPTPITSVLVSSVVSTQRRRQTR